MSRPRTDHDREVTYTNDEISYFQNFLEQASKQFGMVIDTLSSIPDEIYAQIAAVQMRRNLDKQTYERAVQKILYRLAVYDQAEGIDRYGVRIVEIPEKLFDSIPSETTAKEVQPRIEEKIETEKKEIHDDSITSPHLHSYLENLPKNKSISLLAFYPQNLNILRALELKLADVCNYSYSQEEIERLRAALKISQKRAQNLTLSKDALIKLRDAAVIKNNANLRSFLTFEMSRSDDLNIFTNLKKYNTKQAKQIQSLQNKWQQIEFLAMLSTDLLDEMATDLDKLETYIDHLTQELRLNDELQEEYRAKNGINKEEFKNIKKHTANLKQFIAQRRRQVIETMLAKLSLLPKARLKPHEKCEDQKNNVDLVLATVESLVQFGLQKDYVQKLKKQIPPQLITSEQVGKFSDYIANHGTKEQKAARLHLYARAQKSHKKENDNLGRAEPFILIPTQVPGHYDLRFSQPVTEIKEKESEENAEEEKENQDLNSSLSMSLVYIKKADLRQSLASRQDLGKDTVEIESEEKLKSSQPLNVSFFDLQIKKRVCASIVAIPMQTREDEIDEKEVAQFYNLIGTDQLPVKEDISDFVYVFNLYETVLLHQYEAIFSQKTNRDFFVERARHYAVNHQSQLFQDRVSKICKNAFRDTAHQIILFEADKLFFTTEDDGLKKRFVQRAMQLAEKFDQNQNPNPNQDFEFERDVLAETYDSIMKIDAHCKKLKEEMEEELKPEDQDPYEDDLLNFTKEACELLAKSKSKSGDIVEECIESAEIHMLINRHAHFIEEKYRQEFVNNLGQKMESNDDQETEQTTCKKVDAWIKIINNEKKFIRLKTKLIAFFDQEEDAIKKSRFGKYEKVTDDKITAIEEIKTKIQNDYKDYGSLVAYARELENKTTHKNLHAKRGWGSSFSFWANSTLTNELHDFNEVHLPKLKH